MTIILYLQYCFKSHVLEITKEKCINASEHVHYENISEFIDTITK